MICKLLQLESDLKNYEEYKRCGGYKLLNSGAIPRYNLNVLVNCLEIVNQSNSTTNLENDTCDLHMDWMLNEETEAEDPLGPCTNSTTKIFQDKAIQVEVQVKSKVSHKSMQINPSYRNKASQVRCKTQDVGVFCKLRSSLNDKFEKMDIDKHDSDFNSTNDSMRSNLFDTSSSYEPSNSNSQSTTSESGLKNRIFQDKVYSAYTKIIIESDPLLYLGIRKQSMYVIDLLHSGTGISVKNIYIVLKKIKCNPPFVSIAHEFGLSESQVCKIFKTNIGIISSCLKQLVFWPQEKDVLINLPIQFRYRYASLQSIIDCFEIEIEKPSDSVNQALTWSQYKKCNTCKYLISVTPDGLINYISEGVCGRCTDMAIVENCGFLTVLPEKVGVMADRGFKQLDILVQKKGCKLFRPPSVSENVRSSKSDVKKTKRIASIRIHVERVINRIRNFKLLDIHARIDNKLLPYIDDAVFIAAALVNLQSEVIKQI